MVLLLERMGLLLGLCCSCSIPAKPRERQRLTSKCVWFPSLTSYPVLPKQHHVGGLRTLSGSGGVLISCVFKCLSKSLSHCAISSTTSLCAAPPTLCTTIATTLASNATPLRMPFQLLDMKLSMFVVSILSDVSDDLAKHQFQFRYVSRVGPGQFGVYFNFAV